MQLNLRYLVRATLVGIISYANMAGAADVLDFSIHQEYTSTRALGMGNAFSAVAEDYNALFYNPAALALRKDAHLHMFLRGGIDMEYFSLIGDITSAQGSGNPEDQIFSLIQDNYGNHFFSRIPTIGAVWARPNWGIAIIPMDVSIDLSMHQQVGPQINVNGYIDTTFAYSYARNLDVDIVDEKDEFSVGGTLKAIHRVHVEEAVAAADLTQEGAQPFDTDSASEGMTIDADLAVFYTPHIPKVGKWSFLGFAAPSFAVVMRNVFDMGYPLNFHLISPESGEPDKLQRRMDLGAKFDLPNFWVFDPKFAVDIRDILHDNWTMLKGLHMGAEMYWKMFSWWKGHWSMGLNQGYWTAGFGARFGWFQLDLASWGEEVGTSDVPIESRRYMLEMSLDF